MLTIHPRDDARRSLRPLAPKLSRRALNRLSVSDALG